MTIKNISLNRISYLFLFCLLLNSVPVYSKSIGSASQSGSIINGMVFDPDRGGVSDIDVELLNEYSQLIGRTRTAGGGRFTFRGLSKGAFIVRILPARFGFAEQQQGVEIVSFSQGQTASAYVEFYLRRMKIASFAQAAGITSVVFAQEVPDSAEKLYKQGIQNLDENRYNAGIQNLIKALNIFPTYFLVLERLGEEFVKREDFNSAQGILSKAVEVNPKAAASYFLLGYSQFQTKQYQLAIDSLRQATSWSPNSASVFLYLGMSLKQISKYEEAEAQLLKAKQFAKKRLPEVHYQLALLYTNNLKKYSQAADELEIYLKVQTDNKDTESVKKLIKQLRDKAKQGAS